MDPIFNSNSMAVKASEYQKKGQYDPKKHSKYEKPETQTQYNAVDYFQNGLLDRCITRIYFGSYTDAQGFSGFFTDENTIKKCIDQNGRFDANKYSQMAQLNIEGDNDHGYKDSFRNNIIAIDIDYDAMDLSKNTNAELYYKLVNPDGLSPDGNEIKVAFGRAEMNPYQGYDIRQGHIESANQYYMDKDTFLEALKCGIFIVNKSDSFDKNSMVIHSSYHQELEDKGKVFFTNDKMAWLRRSKELRASGLIEATFEQYTKQFKKIDDSLYGERGLNFQIVPKEINSQVVDGNFICRPDEAYHYSINH